jgi:hypothetical protein
MVGDRIPVGGGYIFRTLPDLYTMGTVHFSRGLGVAVTTYSHLAPRLFKEKSCSALSVWTIMANVYFTLTFVLHVGLVGRLVTFKSS